jgi:DNA-binding transcriptional LysR family regulator
MLSINIHRLEVFASVVKHLSVTKAAQELGFSQSALSQHLKILRHQFGELSKQIGRRIVITERGRVFLKEIEPLLSQANALEKRYGAVRTAILSVGSTLGPSSSALPALIKQFETDHPKVAVSLKIGSSLEISKLVRSAKVELAVIANPFLSPLLDMEWFRKERLAVFVATDHPLAKRKQIGADEFAALPLIIRGGEISRNLTDEILCALTTRGVKLNVGERFESPNSVMAAVRDGAGVGVLNYDLIKPAMESGEFKILTLTRLDLTSSSYIVYAKKKSLSNDAQDFLALLRAARSGGRSSKRAARARKFIRTSPSLTHRR